MKKNLLLTLAIVALTSCQAPSQTDGITHVDFQNTTDLTQISDLEITPIDLELVGDNFIGFIAQAQTYKDKLLVLDPFSKGNTMHVYTKQGKQLHSFIRVGRGPGEILSPSRFSINNDKIFLVDTNNPSLCIFSLNDYSFESMTPILFNSTFVDCINDSSLLWQSRSSYNVDGEFDDYNYVVTAKDNLTPTKGVLKKTITSDFIMGYSKPMWKIDGEIHLFDQYLPSIFKLENDTAKEIYRMKFGEFELAPKEFIYKHNKDTGFFKAMEESDYMTYFWTYETKNAILATFTVNHEKYIALYNKNNGQSSMVTMDKFNETIGHEILYFINTDGDSFVGVVGKDDKNPTLVFIK